MVEHIKLLMRRHPLDDLPDLAPLPPGYHTSLAKPDDAEGLALLLTSSFQKHWSARDVHSALLDAVDVDRTWIVTCHGEPVATASAQLPQQDIARGQVHWVATHPHHRRRGLGRSVALRVLHRLRELGCTEALLKTDPPRLSAIRLYLDLGFEPVRIDARHEAVWDELIATL